MNRHNHIEAKKCLMMSTFLCHVLGHHFVPLFLNFHNVFGPHVSGITGREHLFLLCFCHVHTLSIHFDYLSRHCVWPGSGWTRHRNTWAASTIGPCVSTRTGSREIIGRDVQASWGIAKTISRTRTALNVSSIVVYIVRGFGRICCIVLENGFVDENRTFKSIVVTYGSLMDQGFSQSKQAEMRLDYLRSMSPRRLIPPALYALEIMWCLIT